MKNQFVNEEQAIELKKLGFNEPTPHCYKYDVGKSYALQLFAFLLDDDGYLGEVYEDEKILRQFNNSFIQTESDTYFDYNQDIRKLIARRYNGEENMNDPKCFNMNMDSHTYEKLSCEEIEKLKITLPNANEGDFEFSIYHDVMSAPSKQQVIEWMLEKHHIYGWVEHYWYPLGHRWKACIKSFDGGKAQIAGELRSYEEAMDKCIDMLIEYVKD